MIKLFGEAAGVPDAEALIGGINRDFNRVFSEARKYYKEDEDVTVESTGVVQGEVEEVVVEEVTPAEDLPSMEDSSDEFTGMAPDAIDPVSSNPAGPEVDEEHVKEDGSEAEPVEAEVEAGEHPEVSEDTVHEVAEQFIDHINDTITAATGGEAGTDVDTPIATDGGEATTDDSTDVDAPVSDIQTEDGDVQKVDAITVEVNV